MPHAAKTITFGIPCYNSAAYMDTCVSSIVDGCDAADDVEVVIVDDGSTKDDTLAKAEDWERRYPGIVRAVHQENGGHGMAVLKALEHAEGTYFKVVDSDDWLDAPSLRALLATLRSFAERGERVDLVISNYVYEHVEDHTQQVIDYRRAIEPGRVMGWDEVGHFGISKYLLMHSLCYRSDVLRSGGGVPMPAHTFYVDNIYAYVPLPRVRTLYYLDVDLYRYFIGRADQSVNEKVMAGRIDQQLKITRIMIDAYHLYDDVPSKRLRRYMLSYLSIMMTICSVFSKLSDVPGAQQRSDELWAYLKGYDAHMYRHIRLDATNLFTDLPTKAGEKVTIGIYRLANKVVKFN